ncbi:MAG TPA: NAD(P)-binding domain-containing protein, partial [Longimicrobiaceae bacterium]|nr:NAD(P)-binding domain-containing protein [Longimicrobiaceae bacterium]
MTHDRVAVLGAGSWGTALANLLATKGVDTVLWSFESDVTRAIESEHRNSRYLSEIALDPRLRATSAIEEAVSDAGVVVSVSPSHVVRKVMENAASAIPPDALVVSASKGIEVDSLQTMDEV